MLRITAGYRQHSRTSAGVEVISVTDVVFDSGGPGIGFNFFIGNTDVDHDFAYFEVDTSDH